MLRTLPSSSATIFSIAARELGEAMHRPPDLKRPGTLKMLALQHQVSAAAESAAHTAATHDRSVVYYGPHTWRSRLYTGQSDPKLYVCFAFCYNKVIIQ